MIPAVPGAAVIGLFLMLLADYWLARWGLAQLSRMDQQQDQQMAEQEPWMHIPLSRPVVRATSPCP